MLLNIKIKVCDFMSRNFHIQSGYIKVVDSDQLIYYEGWKQRSSIIKSLPDQSYVDYYRGLSLSDFFIYAFIFILCIVYFLID